MKVEIKPKAVRVKLDRRRGQAPEGAPREAPMISIWDALRKRHPPGEWAYFEEMRNGTGYARSARTADAVAFSLYPSRGLELHGIEVKVSRGDWLREKSDPAKAEEIGQFCERWWLATTENVTSLDEIPAAWGWLEWTGKKLMTRKPAPMRAAKPLDKLMIAAILRRASEVEFARFSDAVTANVNERMKEEREKDEETRTRLTKKLEDEAANNRRFLALIHQVEYALGTTLLEQGWGSTPVTELKPEVIERLKLVNQADLADLRRHLQQAAQSLRQASTTAKWALRKAGIRPENPMRGLR